MKKRKVCSLVILCSFLIVGCGKNDSSSPSLKKESTPALSLLESATSPFGGEKKNWINFQEAGGIDRNSSWYGLSLKRVSVKFDDAGFVKEFDGSVSKFIYKVTQIREVINKLCKFKEEDWDRKVVDDYATGTAKNQQCEAVYVPDDSSTMGFSIKRLVPYPVVGTLVAAVPAGQPTVQSNAEAAPAKAPVVLDSAASAPVMPSAFATPTAPTVVVDSSPFSPSFDCTKANSGQERLVCSDRELSKLDVELSQAYASAREAASDKEALRKAQTDWIKQSFRACSDKVCLVSAYKARTVELQK
jgi:uncharacterized protein YecT (DUF1311 family)